ncbi:hypothetical protein AB0N28_01855 [Streptomyces sp. NPDC051130]|uniref:MmyB family transcriptional regulator n=1 Tax=Streptomyces sp. NPDC051130 TaxID=3157223 RepID=UPI003445838D
MAGRNPEDRALAELIGSLLLQSRDFATLWSKHPVRDCTVMTKALHHPVVGPLTLDFENVHLTDGTGHRMLLYTAPRSSPSDAALRLLSSLTAEGGGLGYEAAPQAVTRLARITDTGG